MNPKDMYFCKIHKEKNTPKHSLAGISTQAPLH